MPPEPSMATADTALATNTALRRQPPTQPPKLGGSRRRSGGPASLRCRIAGCTEPLLEAYNQSHRICEQHRRAMSIEIADEAWRFCQQCARLHTLDQFLGDRRSCQVSLQTRRIRKRRRKEMAAEGGAAAGGAAPARHAPARAAAAQPAGWAAALASWGSQEEGSSEGHTRSASGGASLAPAPLPLLPIPSKPAPDGGPSFLGMLLEAGGGDAGAAAAGPQGGAAPPLPLPQLPLPASTRPFQLPALLGAAPQSLAPPPTPLDRHDPLQRTLSPPEETLPPLLSATQRHTVSQQPQESSSTRVQDWPCAASALLAERAQQVQVQRALLGMPRGASRSPPPLQQVRDWERLLEQRLAWPRPAAAAAQPLRAQWDCQPQAARKLLRWHIQREPGAAQAPEEWPRGAQQQQRQAPELDVLATLRHSVSSMRRHMVQLEERLQHQQQERRHAAAAQQQGQQSGDARARAMQQLEAMLRAAQPPASARLAGPAAPAASDPEGRWPALPAQSRSQAGGAARSGGGAADAAQVQRALAVLNEQSLLEAGDVPSSSHMLSMALELGMLAGVGPALSPLLAASERGGGATPPVSVGAAPVPAASLGSRGGGGALAAIDAFPPLAAADLAADLTDEELGELLLLEREVLMGQPGAEKDLEVLQAAWLGGGR